MGLEDVPRCQHVKVNGTQCGSPALRRRRHCYFHYRMLDGKKRFAAEGRVRPRPVFSMCLLEDANSVQVAIMQVLQLLGSGQMDYKMAGLMLYGLQTASGNLRNTKFEAEKATDVVIDRNTVDQTCINGPQWFAQDFAAEKVEESGEIVAAAGAEPVQREVDDGVEEAKGCRAQVRATKSRQARRKRPERAPIERPPSLVRDLFYKLLPEAATAAEARLGPG